MHSWYLGTFRPYNAHTHDFNGNIWCGFWNRFGFQLSSYLPYHSNLTQPISYIIISKCEISRMIVFVVRAVRVRHSQCARVPISNDNLSKNEKKKKKWIKWFEFCRPQLYQPQQTHVFQTSIHGSWPNHLNFIANIYSKTATTTTTTTTETKNRENHRSIWKE